MLNRPNTPGMRDESTWEVMEKVWRTLSRQARNLRHDAQRTSMRNERSEQANGVPRRTYAQAQAQAASGGCGGGDLLWIINACNPNVATGIGVLCWFDPATNVWRRVYDDAIATECTAIGLVDDVGASLLGDDGVLLTE